MKKSFVTLITISLLSFAAIGQRSINEYMTLWYGDGVAEDAFAWAQAGGKCAVKFYPNLPSSVYPFIIVGGSVWINPDWPNGQIIGSSFRIEVYDDDGVDGYPNTLLGAMDCVVDSTGWYEFYGFDILIEEGMFYIAMVQTDLPPDCIGLGIDSWGGWQPEMSFLRISEDTEWEFSIYQNFMIRAFIDDNTVEINDNNIKPVIVNAYPNPFTTSTTLAFELDGNSKIQITIYNTIGELVYQFEDQFEQGSHKASWSPSHLPSGLYYAVLRSEEGVSVVKMVKK